MASTSDTAAPAAVQPVDTSLEQTLPFSQDTELRRRFMIAKSDMPGNLRWGLLLEVLDKMAEEVALSYARRAAPEARVVTAAIDDIVLRTPMVLQEDLHLRARINRVGTTSMEVGIRLDQSDAEAPALASCYFTMVARIEEDGEVESLPLPSLDYASEGDVRRRELAEARREAYQEAQQAAEEPPSVEEYALLKDLHHAQDQPGFGGLLVGDLVRSSWERMYPEQENVPRKIFGGYLIRRAFELAHIHAEEVAAHRPVAVRVNRINFFQPVQIGDKLRFSSRVVYTGDTSICVEINIERTGLDDVTKALSNTCVFTFVNVDEAMQPQPVPSVYPTTYAEDARYLEAYRRHMRHRRTHE